MAKRRKHKPAEEPEQKVTLFQYLASPEALPGLLLLAGGIAVSVIPNFLQAAQTLSMILGLIGVFISMAGLKILTERMPNNR